MNESGEKIIQEARIFMQSKRRATWSDYNAFKQRLINAGCYGQERLLANILNL